MRGSRRQIKRRATATNAVALDTLKDAIIFLLCWMRQASGAGILRE